MAGNLFLPRRAIFVLAVLCLMVLAQSAALSGLCEEHHDSSHSCLLCQTGALPFVQTAVSLAASPSLSIEWLMVDPASESLHDLLLATSSPRAPPV